MRLPVEIVVLAALSALAGCNARIKASDKQSPTPVAAPAIDPSGGGSAGGGEGTAGAGTAGTGDAGAGAAGAAGAGTASTGDAGAAAAGAGTTGAETAGAPAGAGTSGAETAGADTGGTGSAGAATADGGIGSDAGTAERTIYLQTRSLLSLPIGAGAAVSVPNASTAKDLGDDAAAYARSLLDPARLEFWTAALARSGALRYGANKLTADGRRYAVTLRDFPVFGLVGMQRPPAGEGLESWTGAPHPVAATDGGALRSGLFNILDP